MNDNNKKSSFHELLSIADLFKVLGDFTRTKILFALEGKELNVSQICEEIELNASAVSHQLRVLRQAHLVTSNKIGKEVFYKVADEHVSIIFNMALEHINE